MAKRKATRGGRRKTVKVAKGRRRHTPARGLRGWLWRFGLVLLVPYALWLAWLDAQIMEAFSGSLWRLPVSIYGQYEPVVPGQYSRAQVMHALQNLRYDEKGTLPVGAGDFVASAEDIYWRRRPYVSGGRSIPAQEMHVHLQHGVVVDLADFAGRSLPYGVFEPVRISSSGEEYRELVTLDEEPAYFGEILRLVEDREFYDHFGISFRGLARAMWQNLRSRQFVQGGSTLTQQLVKNLFLNRGKTLKRKWVEMHMAILLDARLDKGTILQAYLNEVYLGQNGAEAIHGVGAASGFYFGRDWSQLSIAQSALLVGMIRGPAWYDPRRQPERALARRQTVLDILRAQHVIGESEWIAASREPLNVLPHPPSYSAAPLRGQIVRELQALYADSDMHLEDLQGAAMISSFDPYIQAVAQQALDAVLNRLSEGPGLNGAVVVASPREQTLLAIVGGRNRSFGMDRAAYAKRPIGSLVKPMVVASALEQGQHLAVRLQDVPVRVPVPGGVWEPKNSDGKSLGDIPLLEALAQSRNQAMVDLSRHLDMRQVARDLQQLGFVVDVQKPSFLLGAIDASPLQVANAYLALAAGGVESGAADAMLPLHALQWMELDQGVRVPVWPTVANPFSEATTYQVRWAMQQVLRSGTARNTRLDEAARHAWSVKTGTSDEGRDAWFVALNAEYLVVVWVGSDDNSVGGLYGARHAMPVWEELADALVVPVENFDENWPSDVQWATIDWQNNALSSAACGGITVPVTAANMPKQVTACAHDVRPMQKVRGWWKRLFD